MKTYIGGVSVLFGIELFIYWMAGNNFERSPQTAGHLAFMLLMAVVFGFFGAVFMHDE